MSLSFEPPHAERSNVEHERDEAGEKDDPPAGEAEGFTIVKRKEPGQDCLTGSQLPPITNMQDRPAILIQPDDAVAAGATDFSRLAQADLKGVARLLRQADIFQPTVRKTLHGDGYRPIDRNRPG